MPNEAELKRAEARRAKRKATQEANAEAAKQQDLTLKVDKEAQARAHAAAKDKAAAAKTAPAKKVTRAQMVREAKAAAEVKAAAEALVKPEPVRDDYRPGDKVPLHVLNQRARQADTEARDMATEIGKTVGQFTRDTVNSRVPKRSAFQRRYDAEARQAGLDIQSKQVKSV